MAERHEGEQSITPEALIHEAQSVFLKQSTHESGSAYVTLDAIEAVIIKHELDPIKLLPQLIRFSTLLPKDILEIITPVDPNTTWSDFALQMSYVILGKEMIKMFPEVKEEEDRRIAAYDNNFDIP